MSNFSFCFSSTKMAPNVSMPTGVLHECDDEISTRVSVEVQIPSERRVDLVWRNIILFTYLHMVGVYGAYLCLTSAKWGSVIFGK